MSWVQEPSKDQGHPHHDQPPQYRVQAVQPVGQPGGSGQQPVCYPQIQQQGMVVMPPQVQQQGMVVMSPQIQQQGMVVMSPQIQQQGMVVMSPQVQQQGMVAMPPQIQQQGMVTMSSPQIQQQGMVAMPPQVQQQGMVTMSPPQIQQQGMVAMPPQQGMPQQPQVVFLQSPPMVYHKPPDYNYIPNDFMTLSLLTVILCGIFSPLSLMFSIPALLFSRKSKSSAKLGSINAARSQGVAAAYLNITAIMFALIVFCIVTGLLVGFYGRTYALKNCIASVERRYGGTIPTRDRSWSCN